MSDPFNREDKEAELEFAKKYDEMIPWETRLKREIPTLSQYLAGKYILDLACSTGRHSFALEKYGSKCIGLDYSEGMIAVANKLKKELGSDAEFYQLDISSASFQQELEELSIKLDFEGAILLGNAIANLGSYERALSALKNVYQVSRKNSTFILQTINRPRAPMYLPLRRTNGLILQRIFIPKNPLTEGNHNIELNVNLIDPLENKYKEQNISLLYMFTYDEFVELVSKSGWDLIASYSGYNKEPHSKEDGKTVVWILSKSV